MDNKFTYADIADKCYGIAGRAISLKVLDNSFMIHHVSIEDAEEAMTFTPDFFFCANPRYSAKITWNEMLKQYQLLVGIVIGDIVCRSRVHARRVMDAASIRAMQALVDEEGREHCSLDDDEISTVFDKTFRYLDRIFSDTHVQQLASVVADTLRSRRTLTGGEIEDMLHILS